MSGERNGYWNRRKDCKKEGVAHEPDVRTWFADLEEPYPNLREFLVGMHGVGATIEGGSVLLYCDYQTPRVRLSDRHYGEIAFLTGVTMEELLDKVERNLKAQTVPWRKDQYRQAKGARAKS